MRKFLIFAFILLSCQEEEVKECISKNCFNMIRISKSLPVEFYKNGIPSFNQKAEAGIEKKCFFQPFNCEDNIKLQFYEDEMLTQLLSPPDEWIPIFGTGFVPPHSLATETSFSSYLLSAGVVNRHAYQELEVANGETIKFKIFATFNGSVSPILSFVLMNGVTDTSDPVATTLNGEQEIELTATSDSDRIRITATLDGVSSVIVSLIPDVKAYDLKVLNEDGEDIFFTAFDRLPVEVTQEISDPSSMPTTANGGTQAWVGPNVSLSFGGAGSRKTYTKYTPIERTITEGERVRIFIESGHTQPFGSANITSAKMTVGLFDAGFNLVGSRIFDVDISTPFSVVQWFEVECTGTALYVGVFLEATSSATATTESMFLDYMRIVYDLYPETAIFSKTLTPTEEDICNQYISLQIVDEDDEMLYYTDLLDIQDFHLDTRTLSYSNDKDLDGIFYDLSEFEEDTPSFVVRLESKFYEPGFIQEDEGEDMGDGTVVKLSGSVKEQRNLEIEPLPPFMIRKLVNIFLCNSLSIGNESWVKEETYKHDKLDDKFAFFKSNVFLTLKYDN